MSPLPVFREKVFNDPKCGFCGHLRSMHSKIGTRYINCCMCHCQEFMREDEEVREQVESEEEKVRTELCYCGHRRDKHNPNCTVNGCNCDVFFYQGAIGVPAERKHHSEEQKKEISEKKTQYLICYRPGSSVQNEMLRPNWQIATELLYALTDGQDMIFPTDLFCIYEKVDGQFKAVTPELFEKDKE